MQTKNSQPQFTRQPDPLVTNRLISRPNRVPLSLHRYIWALAGIWGLFIVSFPIAYFRVAQSEKFGDQPFKSITWSENQKDNLVYPEKE